MARRRKKTTKPARRRTSYAGRKPARRRSTRRSSSTKSDLIDMSIAVVAFNTLEYFFNKYMGNFGKYGIYMLAATAYLLEEKGFIKIRGLGKVAIVAAVQHLIDQTHIFNRQGYSYNRNGYAYQGREHSYAASGQMNDLQQTMGRTAFHTLNQLGSAMGQYN